MFKQAIGPKRAGCSFDRFQTATGFYWVNGNRFPQPKIAVFRQNKPNPTSKYMPHNGNQECERRRLQY